MKQEKGITLMALVITVVLLIIIAGVTVMSAIDSVEPTRLEAFYLNLELIQKRVDDIAATNESYVATDGSIVYLKNSGNDLTDTQSTQLQKILQEEGISDEEIGKIINDFRYFEVEDLENELDLFEMEYAVFINFNTRMIVAEKGITIKDKTYYVLENQMNFVEENTEKNKGEIESFTCSTPTAYGENTYKVVVTPSKTIGDIGGTGYVKYKKTTTKYWETSSNTEMILELDVEYNIQYIYSDNHSIEKIIKVEFQKDENGNLLTDENGDNKLDVTDENGASLLANTEVTT